MQNREISPQMVNLIKSGDGVAFADFHNLYSDKIYRYSYNYLKCHEDAEGVVQEVFSKIWEKRSQIRENLSLSGFAFTIAHNTTLNILRKRKNRAKAVAYYIKRSESSHQHVEEDLISNELEASAKLAISALPSKRKRVYILIRHYYLTHKEIAKKLDISTKTVEVHMTHALRDIRKRLLDFGISFLLFVTLGGFIC